MGLPEVADFARNFAVMVRVQGPDPKGLKMRNHAFHKYNDGKTTLSASGMVFPGFKAISGAGGSALETIIVLTAASVIEPFVSQNYRGNIAREKPQLVSGAQIDVLLESKSAVDGNEDALPCLQVQLLRFVNIPESSLAVQSLIEASCGSLENSWEVGWSLASHSSGRAQVEQSSFQRNWPSAREESTSPSIMAQSVVRIAVLVTSSKLSASLPKLQTSHSKRGDLLLAMGSPFGILSPLHFFNNISVGSVGNNYPSGSDQKSLLMADIRCLPGMEGSPVFNEHAQFIGLLTRPLRQKNSGTEIQMVIPWEAILSVCSDLLKEDPHFACKELSYNGVHSNTAANVLPKSSSCYISNQSDGQSSSLVSPVEKAMASICLITTADGSWASGVLLNKQGLVLTNAHLLEPWRFGKVAASGGTKGSMLNVVRTKLTTTDGKSSTQNLLRKSFRVEDASLTRENAQSNHTSGSTNINHANIRVRLDFTDPWMWTDAKVVFISKGPSDVALLQLEVAPDQLCPIVMDVECPSPGSKAYVIGHGLFGPRCDFLPSACLGVVAKVIKAKRSPGTESKETNLASEDFPAMLETTAAVHPGSSGGAVVNSEGHMIGLVTSNAKHGGGTVIPHLNFSIPCAALEPILMFSKDMQNYAALEELDRPNEHLSSVWALMPPLYPKKQEPLPELPQFCAEDRSEAKKGSRFAKFIAERNELLKNAKPGDSFMLSKL